MEVENGIAIVFTYRADISGIVHTGGEFLLMKRKSTIDVDGPSIDGRLVGIGASAGGLEALRELMASLPHSDTLSYVIAQHVSPTHVSVLMSLLAPFNPSQGSGSGRPASARGRNGVHHAAQ